MDKAQLEPFSAGVAKKEGKDGVLAAILSLREERTYSPQEVPGSSCQEDKAGNCTLL